MLSLCDEFHVVVCVEESMGCGKELLHVLGSGVVVGCLSLKVDYFSREFFCVYYNRRKSNQSCVLC